MSQRMPISIRAENSDDAAAIRAITEAAFAASKYGHHGEAELIERLRSACADVLSLVAMEGDRLVGHALFSPVTIQDGESVCDGMGLGPMAVLPEFQGRGIGTLLIGTGLAMLNERQTSFVCVLGEPAFYSRLGFQSAAPFGVYSEFGGETDGSFQIVWLNDGPNDFQRALAKYRPEFSELVPPE